MSDALYETSTVTLETRTQPKCTYRTNSSTKIFDGFTAVYSVSNPSQDDGIGEKDTTLPAMEVGSEPKFVSLNPKQRLYRTAFKIHRSIPCENS